MPKNDGGPAFPMNFGPNDNANTGGMSLRDYFAAKVLIGVESTYDSEYWQSKTWCKSAAKHYYEMADAMLAAREE